MEDLIMKRLLIAICAISVVGATNSFAAPGGGGKNDPSRGREKTPTERKAEELKSGKSNAGAVNNARASVERLTEVFSTVSDVDLAARDATIKKLDGKLSSTQADLLSKMRDDSQSRPAFDALAKLLIQNATRGDLDAVLKISAEMLPENSGKTWSKESLDHFSSFATKAAAYQKTGLSFREATVKALQEVFPGKENEERINEILKKCFGIA